MNEQEIVNILKENKTKGIAFYFFSEDIKDWILDNFNNPNLLYFDLMGNWQYFKDADFDDYDNVVFALPDLYQVKKESKGSWEEFEIDQKGNFHCFIDGDMHYFFWANWNVFLFEADSSGYTAFGGWQYEGDNGWFMAPCCLNNDQHYWNYMNEECRPAIPIKIRFWREVK